MTKRWFSIPAFLIAWMFIFSTVSTCYCLPTGQAGAPVFFSSGRSAQLGMQSKMSSHCSHHSSKTQDCAPRIQNDSFENVIPQVSFEQKSVPQALAVREEIEVPSVYFEKFNFQSVLHASPPSQLYLLHHSFLI